MSSTRDGTPMKVKKPADHITLKIFDGQRGIKEYFLIKRNIKLGDLMNLYCRRQSVELDTICFLHYGRRLNPEMTPDEFGIKDGEDLDAMPRITHLTNVLAAHMKKKKKAVHQIARFNPKFNGRLRKKRKMSARGGNGTLME